MTGIPVCHLILHTGGRARQGAFAVADAPSAGASYLEKNAVHL